MIYRAFFRKKFTEGIYHKLNTITKDFSSRSEAVGWLAEKYSNSEESELFRYESSWVEEQMNPIEAADALSLSLSELAGFIGVERQDLFTPSVNFSGLESMIQGVGNSGIDRLDVNLTRKVLPRGRSLIDQIFVYGEVTYEMIDTVKAKAEKEKETRTQRKGHVGMGRTLQEAMEDA